MKETLDLLTQVRYIAMMKILDYEFEGPFDSIDQIDDRSGLVVITSNDGNKLYVGQSTNLREQLSKPGHQGIECAKKTSNDSIQFWVYYTPKYYKIKDELVNKVKPPCNEKKMEIDSRSSAFDAMSGARRQR